MIDSLSIIAPSVFAFYIVVATNFIPEIIGCRLQHVLRTNMLAKHVLAIILLFFLVVFISPSNSDRKIVYNISLTLLVYVWFYITTRSPIILAILSIMLLLVVYILSTKKDRLNAENKKDEAQKVQRTQYYIIVLAITISIIGFVLYLIEKRAEYKDNFSFWEFILGKTTCANYTSPSAKIL